MIVRDIFDLTLIVLVLDLPMRIQHLSQPMEDGPRTGVSTGSLSPQLAKNEASALLVEDEDHVDYSHRQAASLTIRRRERETGGTSDLESRGSEPWRQFHAPQSEGPSASRPRCSSFECSTSPTALFQTHTH